MNNRPLKIISGSSHPKFAKDVADNLGVELVNATISHFDDDETQIEIHTSIRGADTFIIQSGSRPANHNLMELFFILDALKRSHCWRRTAVMPLYPYARADRKVKPHVPISAKTVADLLKASGMDRLVTMDLHAGQISGFFDCPVDNLYANTIFIKHIKEKNNLENTCIVSPDIGGSLRADTLAKQLGCHVAIIYKRRGGPGQIESTRLIGDVSGMKCILVDDMIASGGTMVKAAELLKENGAIEVSAYATHAILTGTSVSKIDASEFSKVYVTDSVPLNKYAAISNKIEVLSVAPLFAEAIKRVHKEVSLADLFVA
jgi:ribose-phosphate pyrophosphokinase